MAAVLGALWGAGGPWQNHLKTWNPFFKKRNFERLILTSTKARSNVNDVGNSLSQVKMCWSSRKSLWLDPGEPLVLIMTQGGVC